MLIENLATRALERFPDWASVVLEKLDEVETAQLLESLGPAAAAPIVERLSPHYTAAVLRGFPPDWTAQMLATLPIEVATRVVRQVEEAARPAILDALEPQRAQSLRRVLQFRPGTAGSVMDPDVLALPAQLTAGEALDRIRKSPQLARYNLYVVDSEQRLVGVLNLRELLLADEALLLSERMVRDPQRVLATDARASLIAHPGWKLAHALPVVDKGGTFLGAIRYRVLRELEEELKPTGTGDVEAGAALGELFAAGARGLFEAVAGSGEPKRGSGS